ncbi:cell wall-binding repeat-containing protein [Agromyces sp. NPDC058484]|uniref:cell wall-binding repeat-containing protein n=1 Tax=Agromyces sp. NPDC058484 TaxID=3346524 RepID=UPI003666ED70
MIPGAEPVFEVEGGTRRPVAAHRGALDRAELRNSYTVSRYAGADRYSTGVEINQAAFPSASTVYLAVGTGFADALAGGALAGATNSPLFLV